MNIYFAFFDNAHLGFFYFQWVYLVETGYSNGIILEDILEGELRWQMLQYMLLAESLLIKLFH